MKFICPQCLKDFNLIRGLLKDYVYKINKPYNKEIKLTYFCSYKCWRANGGGVVNAKINEGKDLD